MLDVRGLCRRKGAWHADVVKRSSAQRSPLWRHVGTATQINAESPPQDRRAYARTLQPGWITVGPDMKLYANLKPPENPQPMQNGFYQYVPEVRPAPVPTAEGVVQAAFEARRRRILDKEESRTKGTGLCPTDVVETPCERW